MINFLNNWTLFNLVKLSDIGEREIIKHIIQIVGNKNITGDDSAYIPYGNNYILVTTDMIRKRTHFPDIMSPRDVGWFASAVNLSDIAAMGGKPIGVLLSLGLPRDIEERYVLEIMKGAEECTRYYNTHIIGGDTKEHDEITIGGVAIGTVPKDEILLRKGISPGDALVVTDHLGKAGAGYLSIKHNISTISKSGLIRPIPRIREGRNIAKEHLATSCMDISDGLSSSLYQLMKINNVGFSIDGNNLPISEEAIEISKLLGISSYSIATDYGGDYELLFTIPEDRIKKVKEMVGVTQLTQIGVVTKEKEITISIDGKKTRLANRGYEHFISL